MKFGQGKLSRRRLLGGAAAATAALPVVHELVPHRGLHHALDASAAEPHTHNGVAAGGNAHAAHLGAVGTVDPRVNGFDPQEILRDFDEGRMVNGVREWELVAEEKEIEVAPGVKYAAWAYNGRVPGPTLRAREGDRLRIRLTNGSKHPHTIHFHGIHPSAQDGVAGLGAGNVEPGQSTTYEFVAEPFGLHLYHCHTMPLAEHIAKGLYGAFIIDPKNERPKADELVMVMNGFDTNFDRSNEVYAVNTVAFDYMHRPVRVKRGELVRIYLVNLLEFDPLNSFHIHANFFDYFPTGTRLEPRDFTDTVIQGQGERGVLELRFPYTGKYMFHAHVSEFAELGWMGFFEVDG
jgi:FtsP/CotA-like multicopper oxidase with cupredoxin domain